MQVFPIEISNTIKNLIYLPEIDIIQLSQKEFYFGVKSQFINNKILFTTSYLYLHYGNHLKFDQIACDNKINKFINELNNNLKCYYTENNSYYDQIFQISVSDKIIKLSTKDSIIEIPIECKNQLISVMKKYRDLLKSY